MFRLVSDESSLSLGIEVHKPRFYEYEAGLLRGRAMHDSTTRDFTISVEPNYGLMSRIAEEKKGTKLKHEFDSARAHTISLGTYPTLSVADYAIQKLSFWYKEVLKNKGANQRFLVEDGNEQHLVEDAKASDLRYGDAILRARSVQAFAMMRENQPLDHQTVVGRIMPVFLQALGLKEYKLTHDLSKEGTGEVRFILENVGIFAFQKPLQEGGPAYLERYSYSHGNYRETFSGEVTGDVMKTAVFGWLTSAAKELSTLSYKEDELDEKIDEISQDVRRSYILRERQETPALFQRDNNAAIHTACNVVQLGAFRPR